MFHPPMSSTEPKPTQTPTPAEIPFTTPQVMVKFVTDTGKILPRKYTGLTAKHQRAVTRTLKRSRNMLLSQ
jgi:small subunit ribosomal protein S18